MGQVIQLCNRCGFEIPSDASRCPSCRDGAESSSLADRLIVGAALPSRSVHALQTLAPRREPAAVRTGSADGARAAFGYASLLIGVALVCLVLSWVLRLEPVVLEVPSGLAHRLHQLSVAATGAALVALVLGLVALAAREVRRLVLTAVDHLSADDPLA